jgi:hypothetical protein
MAIDPVTTNSTSGTSDIASFDVSTLGPAEILAYVRIRLSDIDSQMEAYMEASKKSKKHADELGAFQTLLTELNPNGNGYSQDEHGKTDGEHAAANAAVVKKLQDFSDKTDDPDLKARCSALATGASLGYIPIGDLNAHLGDVKQKLEDMNRDNEMSMMRLSSLMQTRTQIVQFCSNVLATLNEGAKTAIGNMRS